MENIEKILKDAGLEVTAEQLAAVQKSVKENYKTLADYDAQKLKLTAAEEKVSTLSASMEKFKDTDPEKLESTIAEFKKQISDKDAEYASKLAERDLNDLIQGAIRDAHGLNAKAITALLDDSMEDLRKSKNQKDDVTAAIKKLREAEDSKMLFSNDDTDGDDSGDSVDHGSVVGQLNAIGSIKKGGSGDAFAASLRSSMGLPPEKQSKTE